MNARFLARRAALVLLAAGATALTSLPVLAQSAAPRVLLQTSMGNITVELNPQKAPKTVENFLQYVAAKQYDGTIFHRVIADFMVQGGGMTANMAEKPTRASIPLEAKNGLTNDRGTIAMARTMDPNSAAAQFFINVVDNNGLNAPRPDGHGYAVFGKVIAGMEVVDKIRAVPTGNRGPHRDVPVTPITINSATLVQ